MNVAFKPAQKRPVRRSSIAFLATAAVISLGLAYAVGISAYNSKADKSRTAAELLAGDADAIKRGRELALERLKDHPLDARLLRALAMSAEQEGRPKEAAALMQVAGNLTWRDAPANVWLFRHNVLSENFVSAMRRADALLRTRSEVRDSLMPVMAALASNQNAAKPLNDRLSFSPPWRPEFLRTLSSLSPPGVTFNVLNGLKDSKSPPSVDESALYVQRLIYLQKYEEAYLGALLLLPSSELSAVGNLFNGDFQQIAGIAPFDWSIGANVGASVTIEEPPQRARDRAAHILHDGVSSGPVIQQAILLPPGRYSLVGEARSDTPQTTDRLQWQLRCLDTGKALSTASVAIGETWQKFAMPFEVPADCDAQMLFLGAPPAERRTTIDVWYDKLAIQRDSAA